MADQQAQAAVDRVARESYGRLVAYLASRSRDIAAAEDALADAFGLALRHWPKEGLPRAPEAWLLTAARRQLGKVGKARPGDPSQRGGTDPAHRRGARGHDPRRGRHGRRTPQASLRLRPSGHRRRGADAAHAADGDGTGCRPHCPGLRGASGHHEPAPGARQGAHPRHRDPLRDSGHAGTAGAARCRAAGDLCGLLGGLGRHGRRCGRRTVGGRDLAGAHTRPAHAAADGGPCRFSP